MASFYLQGPAIVRSFALSASSNGSPATTQRVGPVVLELPLAKIRRPLMRTRANDPQKVQELADSIKEIGLQVPIDVLEVDGVYYGMSMFLWLPPLRGASAVRAPNNTLQGPAWNKRNLKASSSLKPVE
ncbi:sulfiredoxin, chloroplastic/mitochondrial isoform X1 [Beta vulgaris subsp. vulgaris]|uniref:sulfiredoxin, chloroplastic/mitochondrial isoform X1 n=1 Tax=Beta vulgaris subsp. vulgaris TaxID=3555 RepID=UPI002036701D|nr:sulfiredoxin, chloroplastic/mitochondrial isoform X1 [Beta vulgaris subsp. vulgaris]